jgi:DNA-binding winged helix-turn-helix (wHTH) protein
VTNCRSRLWDTFVEVEHNLNTAVNKIREVLDDSADNPLFVETIPRRSYRFIATCRGCSLSRAARGTVSSRRQKSLEDQDRSIHTDGGWGSSRDKDRASVIGMLKNIDR